MSDSPTLRAAAPNAVRFAPRRLKWWRPYRLLMRFESAIAAYRLWRRLADHCRPPPRWPTAEADTVTGPLAAAAASLRTQGYFAGLALADDVVERLVGHAVAWPCRVPGRRGEEFLIGEVVANRSPEGRVVAVADVDLGRSAVLDRLVGHELLLGLAHDFLGYAPREVEQRLYWSPRGALSDEDRRSNGQTVDFHYDIERRPTLYCYFYLTDTTAAEGAHVVVARSHRSRPFGLKCRSTRQPAETVHSVYGKDNDMVIEGPAGFGFVEDPACYHKVLPPRTASRLILQLRYS